MHNILNYARANITRYAIVLMTCLACSLLIEVFAFNYQFWLTIGNEPIVLETPQPTQMEGTLTANSFSYKISKSQQTCSNYYEYDIDNLEVTSMQIKIEEPINSALVRIDICDSSKANSPYRLDDIVFSEDTTTATQSVKVFGYLKQLDVYAQDASGYPIKIEQVTLNANVPPNFQFPRVLLMALAFIFLYAFRPKSVLWAARHAKNPKVALAFFLVVLVVVTPFYNLGIHQSGNDPASNWGTEKGRAFDEYAELAKAIVDRGELYLDLPESAAWLAEMDDASSGDARLLGNNSLYDPSARAAICLSDDSEYPVYKVDGAFYDGKYYVYYGVVPCLLAYVPYYALTGDSLPNTFAMFPAILVFAIFSYLILDLIARRKFPDASAASVCLSYLAILLASCVVYAAAFPWFYLVSSFYALGLLMAGTYVLMRAHCAAKLWLRRTLTCVGAFLLALTMGCRPTVAIAAVVVGVVFLVFEIKLVMEARKMPNDQHAQSGQCAANNQNAQSGQREKEGMGTSAKMVVPASKSAPQIASVLACCILPVALVLAGLFWYNAARFGSPLDFGIKYNLTTVGDMTLRSGTITSAVEDFMLYFFSVPKLIGSFPYIDLLKSYPVLGAPFGDETEILVSGILFAAPFALVALCEMFDARQKKFIRAFIVAAFVYSAALGIFEGGYANVSYRYICDFGFAIGFASALAMLSVSKSARCGAILPVAGAAGGEAAGAAGEGGTAHTATGAGAAGAGVGSSGAGVQSGNARELPVACGPGKVEIIYFVLICLTICFNLVIRIAFSYLVVGSINAGQDAVIMQQIFDILGPVIR